MKREQNSRQPPHNGLTALWPELNGRRDQVISGHGEDCSNLADEQVRMVRRLRSTEDPVRTAITAIRTQ